MSDGTDNNSQSVGNRVMNYNLATPINAVTKGGLIWVWLAIILYIFDWFLLGFDGINFRRLISTLSTDGGMWIIKAAFNGIVAIILTAYIIFFRHEDKREILTFSLAVMATSIIISLVSWDFASILHIVFAWSMVYLLFQKAGVPKSDSYMLLVGLLIVDFFAFSIIASFGNLIWFNRLIIPIHFLISVMYTKDSGLKNFLIFVVVIFYLLQVVSTAIDYKDITSKLNQGQKVTAKQSVNRAIENLKAIYNGTMTSIKNEINDTKKDLGGTTYISEVDANSKRDLGVDLEKVEASATTYLEGERIIVYGNLKGRSMDDDTKVKVFITCSAKNEWYDDQSINGTVDRLPVYEINMGLYEEKFFTCEINNATKGSWSISVNAYFNFTTQGYLKSYFIDKERYLSLKSKDIDVFEVFGITERTPISKSINGPAKIGIATVEPPTLISDSNSDPFNSYVGVSLVNNWPGGRITKVNNIHITIPEGLSLKNCEDRFDDSPQHEPYTEELTYSLTEDYIKKLQSRKTIDTVSEKCGLELDSASRVLGDAPFTTKYFKASVDYEYLLKKTVTVMINPNPELEAARKAHAAALINETYSLTRTRYNSSFSIFNAKKLKYPSYTTEYGEIATKFTSILQKNDQVKNIGSKQTISPDDIKKINTLNEEIDKLFEEIDMIFKKIDEAEAAKTPNNYTCETNGESCETKEDCEGSGTETTLYTCPADLVCCVG